MTDLEKTNQKQAQPTNFEEALNELDTIVRQLENGTLSLDDSIKNYERGQFLKNYCEAKLKEATLKVEKINAASASD